MSVTRENATEAADQELFRQVFEQLDHFSPANNAFVLVADVQSHHDDYGPLAQIPWSAIVDLDPHSDQKGLHKQMAAHLSTHRGVHSFSGVIPITNFKLGTAWMFASGWLSKGEDSTDFRPWTYGRLQQIRTFAKEICVETSPDRLFVIYLPGDDIDSGTHRRAAEVIRAFDEASQGAARMADDLAEMLFCK